MFTFENRKPSQAPWRTVLLALLALSLAACTKPPTTQVNGEGIGGGGRLDTAKRRLLAVYAQYAEKGIPTTWGLDYGSCAGQHGTKVCGRLSRDPGDGTRLMADRRYQARYLAQFRTALESIPLKAMPGPLRFTGSDGSTRVVDAYVPKDRSAILFDKTFLDSPDVDDAQIVALLGHEVGHLVVPDGAVEPPGDETALGEAGDAGSLFDRLGAAAAATPTKETGYADVVRQDNPVAFYRFEDAANTRLATDESGASRNATVLGTVRFRESGIPALGSSARFSSAALASGAIQTPALPLNLTAGGINTVEMWLRPEGDSYAQTVANLGPLNLVIGRFFAHGFGFSTLNGFTTGVPDMLGIEMWHLQYKDDWFHVVAKVKNGDLAANELWINGVKQTLIDRRPETRPQAAIAGAVLTLSGWSMPGESAYHGWMDEVAVYAGELSEERIRLHHFAGRPHARVSGRVAVEMISGQQRTTSATVPLPLTCNAPHLATFAQEVFVLCGTANGPGPCNPGTLPTNTGHISQSLRQGDKLIVSAAAESPVWTGRANGASRPVSVDYQAICEDESTTPPAGPPPAPERWDLSGTWMSGYASQLTHVGDDEISLWATRPGVEIRSALHLTTGNIYQGTHRITKDACTYTVDVEYRVLTPQRIEATAKGSDGRCGMSPTYSTSYVLTRQ